MAHHDVTELLKAVRDGEPEASARLMEAVHAVLWQMAERWMSAERSGHTLQPTALVSEAYLRLLPTEGSFEDRAHFFGAAAKAMERVLLDHARRKRAQKRGGALARVTLTDLEVEAAGDDLDLFEVHEALMALEEESPVLAAVVRDRYFLGLSLDQMAEIHGISLATVKRRWAFARAWLYERLDGGDSPRRSGGA